MPTTTVRDLVPQAPPPTPQPNAETRPQQIGNAAVRQYGLRLDVARLNASEREEIARLAVIASTDKLDLARVDTLGKRDRRSLERLLERAADRDGFFQRDRDEVALARKLRDLAVAAKRPSRRPKYEQAGSVALPRKLVTAYVEKRIDLACFAVLVDAVVHEQVVGGDHVVDRPGGACGASSCPG
jgi:hypothetical protein